MKRFLYFITFVCCLLTACIDDSVSTDVSFQPVFNTDSVLIGPVLSGTLSPTCQVVVYNPWNKGIKIESIALTDNDDGVFRMNVDGQSGTFFNDIVISGGDSIYIFLDAMIPQRSGDRECNLMITVSGKSQNLPIKADIVEVESLISPVIEGDAIWDGNLHIMGKAEVTANSSLTVCEGANIYFSPDASLEVNGKLVCKGSSKQPIQMIGDRLDRLAPEIPYELIPGQWQGIKTGKGAHIEMRYTSVRNANICLEINDDSDLLLFNCQLRNATGNVARITNGEMVAIGSEFAEAAKSVIEIENSSTDFFHCTVANFWLFSSVVEPMIKHDGISSMRVVNSVLFGLCPIIEVENSQPVSFFNCLFELGGEDDRNFIDCIWGKNPELRTVREEYLFDYRPSSLSSPVIGASNPSLTPAEWTEDRFGVTVGSPAPLGAYCLTPQSR